MKRNTQPLLLQHLGTSKLLGSPFRFARHGQSGAEISELLPHLAAVADKIALVKSVHTDEFNHAPAQLLALTGNPRFGGATLGSWVTYGLGCEAEECARRFALDRYLPLRLVGGYPVIDTPRIDEPPNPGDKIGMEEAARGIGGFLLSRVGLQSTVLFLEREARREPLVRAVVRRLVRATRRRGSLDGARGGLLLLLDAGAGVDRTTRPPLAGGRGIPRVARHEGTAPYSPGPRGASPPGRHPRGGEAP